MCTLTQLAQLGIPTANIPITGLDVGGHTDLESGIFYGFAGISLVTASSNSAHAETPPNPKNDEENHKHIISPPQRPLQSQRVDGVEASIYPMVMSIGWNPFYQNEVRSVEVHIIHKFKEDFYNALMNLTILGFIRHEQNYDSLESLVTDIKTDIDVTTRSLGRPAYATLTKDPYLVNFDWAKAQME